MDKYINWVIYGLLILSFWALLSIGIGLIPLISISNISQESWSKLNVVCLNLAYSYLAGFVIFTLTVTIPQYKRKMLNMPLIKKMINDFYSGLLMDYFMFCVENKSLTLNETNERFLNNYRRSMDKQFGESTLRHYIEKRTNNDRYKSIDSFRQQKIIFIDRMIPFENHLSANLVFILNQLRQREISFVVDGYETLKENGRDEIDNVILSVLDEHIKLAKQLKETL